METLYKGKTWKDGYLHAQTTEFGQFTIKKLRHYQPKIFDYTYNKITENSGIVSVKISDNEIESLFIVEKLMVNGY